MARVTVEDCVDKIPNRYELVMIAAQRARDIAAGAVLTIERDNDKNPVIALREIAQTSVDTGVIQEDLIRSFQSVQNVQPEEEELTDLVLPDPKFGDDGLIGAGSLKDLSESADDDEDSDDDLDGLTVYDDESMMSGETTEVASEPAADDSPAGEDSE